MKRNRFWLGLAVVASLVVGTAGCGPTYNAHQNQEKTTQSEVKEEVALNENIVSEIKERGYLNVGCKTDVPGLSYYDETTDTWSGLEIELAYKTAADLFETSPEEVKEKELVHFTGVTVADREAVLESGDIDCMLATYTITEERAVRFALSDSYYTDYVGLMVKDSGATKDNNSLGSRDIRSIADLDGKYIGVPRNATTRDHFLKYIDTMNTVKVSPIFCEFESYEALFKALKDGNIDVMSVDVSILNGYVDSTTKILSDRFAGQHYGAAVKKENALLLDSINAAIAQ